MGSCAHLDACCQQGQQRRKLHTKGGKAQDYVYFCMFWASCCAHTGLLRMESGKCLHARNACRLDADVDMCSPYSRREGSSSSASCSKQFPGAAAQGHFRTMMTYASSSQPTAAPALHSLCMNTLPLSASNLLPGFAASSPAVPMPTMGRGFQVTQHAPKRTLCRTHTLPAAHAMHFNAWHQTIIKAHAQHGSIGSA